MEREKPVPLNFVRPESASCREMVLLPAFDKGASVLEGQTVPAELIGSTSGDGEFACEVGMSSGKVFVE